MWTLYVLYMHQAHQKPFLPHNAFSMQIKIDLRLRLGLIYQKMGFKGNVQGVATEAFSLGWRMSEGLLTHFKK